MCWSEHTGGQAWAVSVWTPSFSPLMQFKSHPKPFCPVLETLRAVCPPCPLMQFKSSLPFLEQDQGTLVQATRGARKGSLLESGALGGPSARPLRLH